MEPRELDIQVAEKVMDIRVCHCWFSLNSGPQRECEKCGRRPPAPYSANVDQAMKVFDRMRELGHRWLLNADAGGVHLRRVVCVHQNDIRQEKEYTSDRPLGSAAKLEDLPKVICEAAVQELEAHQSVER